MLSNNSKESTIVILLISFCLISALIGFFGIKRNCPLVQDEGKSAITDSLKNDEIAVIAFEGPIFDTFQAKTPFKSGINLAELKDELKKAKDKDNIKAVILRLNSPGGTVAASQEIYQLILNLRKSKKPVIVSMSDVCASGCYYIASAANSIVANPGTLTGSIGVISQGLNYKGLMQKFGVYDQTFKAGKFKDLGSGMRDLSLEERQVMQSLLDDSYDQFLSDIVSSRKIDRAKLEKLAQGLIYTGRTAKKAGLVDHLGTYEDSKKICLEILKNQYHYKRISSIRFNENLSKNKLSRIEEFFDFGLSNKMSSQKFLDYFSRLPLTFNQYELLWTLSGS